MTKDDIIRMAREVRFMEAKRPMNLWSAHTDQIEAFAALVAAHEREECLKLVDEQIHNMTVLDSYPEQSGAIYRAIINIRARGKK